MYSITKGLLILLAVAFLCIPASAAVTFNNTNNIACNSATSLSTPMSVTGGGSNQMAFATVWVDEASGTGMTFTVSATYNGVSMTSAGSTAYNYSYAPISSQVFYLAAPSTGSNTLVVTATASSGAIQEVCANLVSFNGVNQVTPVRAGSYQLLGGGTVASFTATIPSNTSDLTIGSLETSYPFFTTPASNQTVDGTANYFYGNGNDHATTAASTVSDTWSWINPYAYYAYVGFSIQPVSTPSTSVSRRSAGTF